LIFEGFGQECDPLGGLALGSWEIGSEMAWERAAAEDSLTFFEDIPSSDASCADLRFGDRVLDISLQGGLHFNGLGV
jgi:hypothetical protein